MHARNHLALLALLPLLLPAAPASAAVWQACKSPVNTMVIINDVQPTGIGYAKAQSASSWATTWYRTQDGGKSWKSVKPPLANTYPDMWTLASGNAIVTWEQQVNGVNQLKVGLYNATNNKTTAHTVETPKGLKIERAYFTGVAAIPGQSKAFAWGGVYYKAGTGGGLSTKPLIWYWDGTTAWKLTKATSTVDSVAKLVAASPTAAWFTTFQPGEVLFWNSTALKQVRKAAASGETIELLKAVPAVGKSPAAVWFKLTYTLKNQQADKLLLCDAAKCIEKKAAGTYGKNYGRFLTHAFFKPYESAPGTREALGGFDAASSTFALVWELLPSNSPDTAAVKLQQYNGATNKWTAVLTTTRQFKTWTLSGPIPFPAGAYSPQLLVSVASANRAVAVQSHIFPPTSTKASVVSHSWNGAKWTPVTTFTFDKKDAYFEEDYNQATHLQALASGNALLALNGGMRRLA